MTNKIQIFKTERQAISQAKSDYAGLMGIKRESVRIEKYNGYGSPKSCQCDCGETPCIELQPKGVSYNRLMKITNGNRGLWYGICENCGEKY